MKIKSILNTFLTAAVFIGTAQAGVINNNEPWLDDSGEQISANGGSIIKENDVWYWVGHRLDPTDQEVHFDTVMYKNNDFGSSGWVKVGTPIDVDINPDTGKAYAWGRPSILKNSNGKFIIAVKKSGNLGFWISDGTDIEGTYSYLQEWSPGGDWTVQDMSLTKIDGKGYLTAHLRRGPKGDREHKISLYKLTNNLTNVSNLIWEETRGGVEAPNLWRANGGKYYITVSQTNGWGASSTKYWLADSFEPTEAEFIWYGNVAGDDWHQFPFMHDGNEVRRQDGGTVTAGRQVSYMSQHDFIQFVDGQVIYSGDRFPMFTKYQDNTVWGGGQNLMLPVTFNANDQPKIKWGKVWNLNGGTYDITDVSW